MRDLAAPCAITAVAAIAQLGERQTEDLKVPGSIPGLGMLVLSSVGFGAWSLFARVFPAGRLRNTATCLQWLDPPRTRTWNLRLRGPTPYPLGQRAVCNVHAANCLVFLRGRGGAPALSPEQLPLGPVA